MIASGAFLLGQYGQGSTFLKLGGSSFFFRPRGLLLRGSALPSRVVSLLVRDFGLILCPSRFAFRSCSLLRRRSPPSSPHLGRLPRPLRAGSRFPRRPPPHRQRRTVRSGGVAGHQERPLGRFLRLLAARAPRRVISAAPAMSPSGLRRSSRPDRRLAG